MNTKRSNTSNPVGTARRVIAATLTLAVSFAVLVAPVGADEGQPATGQITITQHDSAIQEGCLPSAFVLTRQVHNTSEYFELVVRASAPPCDPVHASAVRYAMPGNGVTWPQTLVEKVDFTISKAGTTTIRFDKTCDPMQFDVITGDAPPVISPEGDHHGPLLFPLDTDTALQHWGCVENSTTTSTSTTSTTTPSTTTSTLPTASTSTVPTEVLPTSTVPVTAPTTVLGANEIGNEAAKTPAVGNTEVKADKLARTGTESGPLSLMGLTLALTGAVLLVLSRRRAAAA